MVIGIAVVLAPGILVTNKVHLIYYNVRIGNSLCSRSTVPTRICGVLTKVAGIIVTDITCIGNVHQTGVKPLTSARQALVYTNLLMSLVDSGYVCQKLWRIPYTWAFDSDTKSSAINTTTPHGHIPASIPIQRVIWPVWEQLPLYTFRRACLYLLCAR